MIYNTSNQEIISLYNDYLFLKMNLDDFNEELEKISLYLISKRNEDFLYTYHINILHI